MFRDTVLSRVDCDLKSLPLGATEAFMLSQVDGQLTLEEIAEVVGLEISVALRVARRLDDLGAVTVVARAPSHSRAPKQSMKAPPRQPSERMHAVGKQGKRASTASMPPVQTRRSTPAPASAHRSPAPASSRSRTPPPHRKTPAPASKSPRSGGGKSGQHTAVDDACDLDEATRTSIIAMSKAASGEDHYSLLGVARDADKKSVKRAFAELAGKYHPDRFFGKKLGPMRAPLERVFRALTAAHDTLVDRDLRRAYDATLPPPALPPASHVAPALPPVEPASEPPAKPSRRPSVKVTRVAADEPSTPPPVTRPEKPRTNSGGPPAALIARLNALRPPPLVSQPPAAASSSNPPASQEALKRLYATTKQAEKQRRVELFVAAGDAAAERGDVVTAANNYRIALQNVDDPDVRRKLDVVDARARDKLYDTAVARARAAEREGQWRDAASNFTRAHSLRPAPDLAERAAYALTKSEGDLHLAAKLAEEAVAARPNDAGARATLGEVYFAAKLYRRSAREADKALELSPHDARAKALSSEVKKHIKD